MYLIKRYANGRFYDTVEKNFVNRKDIKELMRKGKKISITDTRTGKDITADVKSKIEATAARASKKPGGKKKKKADDSAGIFVQLFRKGSDTLFDYGKKYSSMWQNLVTMSKDEVDKVINMLKKENRLSDIEAGKLKDEINRYRSNIQGWINRNIDSRINEILSKMNLANRDQVLELTGKIKDLTKKIKKMEKKK
ncbi:MAG: hypothetical protein GXP53_13780 [Deltaproteobacteria bacterium]|nr:hypothetical protein [Deltaproteobacteria bacterium]